MPNDLGAVLVRACRALSLDAPAVELIRALNSDNPRQALLDMIHAVDVEMSDSSGSVPRAPCLEARDQHLLADAASILTRLFHAIAQLTLSSADTEAARAKLQATLMELEQQELRRQADRRPASAELTPVALQQLSEPGRVLTPFASRDCLVSCMAHGRRAAARAAGERLVVVLGNTGAGKSAFVNLLHGCSFARTEADRYMVAPDSPVPELMSIGHTNQSRTFVPQIESAVGSLGAGRAYADCPGFLDTRGFEINVANAVNVRQAVAAAASCVVVVIINYHSLLADRGKGVKDLLTIVSGLFGTAAAVRAHAGSILLAISQAPARHAESGAPISLQRHAARLLDPSGLDEASREMLSALGANVVCYHLLGPGLGGDPTWLDRGALLSRIAQLVPITTPSALFCSAIAEHDKESLRALVSDLCEEVRAAMASGAYEAAADQVADLLAMKHAQSPFISRIVDESVVRAVLTERLVVVRAAIEACGGSRGGDETSSPCDSSGGDASADSGSGSSGGAAGVANAGASELSARFEAARTQLRELGSVLVAFAGIPEVREKLVGLLTSATLDLESAAHRAAEAAGRKAVEEPMRELLRACGENAVKEVLALPAAAARMRTAQQSEREVLTAAHAEELRALRQGATEERRALLEAAHERHALELMEADLRTEGASAAWRAHTEHANAKLAQYDATLLAGRGGAFWARVGGSMEASFGEQAPGRTLDWARKQLDDEWCEVVGAVLRAVDSTRLTGLFLSGNQIADAGLIALVDATAFGALRNLERLFLDNNRFGDEGTVELARTLAEGRMPMLTFLDANRNQIADVGTGALARAVAKGALARLDTLYLHKNAIGDAGALALVASFGGATGADPHVKLPMLTRLYLGENCIGEEGLAALARAHAEEGVIPALKVLQLDGNTTNAVRWARLQ